MADNPSQRPLYAGPETGPEAPFPLRLGGKVIKGFGRGSSELGIPTANIPIEGLSVGGNEDVKSGVYFGWAGLSPSPATRQHAPGTESKYQHMGKQIFDGLLKVIVGDSDADADGLRKTTLTHDRGAVYPMVMSIGWNPFYKNTVRSVEVHIMHHFEHQFYDSQMNLVILGFIRPELDYVSKEKLIDDIKTDIDVAGRSLSRPGYAQYSKDKGLLEFAGKGDVGV